MDDSGEWALSWFADLLGPSGPGMSRPVVLHDRRCADLAIANLTEQLRELRRPIDDGVPKNGRYAVVYERRWGGRDCVWLEAAEYAFGMIGARCLYVQPVRRLAGGTLVADGDPREVAEADLAGPLSPDLRTAARAFTDSVRSGARRGLGVLQEGGEAAGRALRTRLAAGGGEAPSDSPGGGGPAGGPTGMVEPAGPVERPSVIDPAETAAPGTDQRSLRERLAGLPTALIVLVWVGVLLLGALSAVSLTEFASSSRAAAKSRVAEHSAGQTANLRPASTAVAAAPEAPARAAHGPAPGPARGDLGLPVPLSHPACDGGYGVIVANATRPGDYRHEISEFLSRYSGASYLLAEQACTSLRARTESGDSIYAVYYGPYPALGNACATRSRIGGGSYVRKLDNGPESRLIVKC